MCSGAIYTGGIRREAFFAVGKNDVFPLVGFDTRSPMLQMDSRTVLATGQEPVDVIGPLRAGTQLHSKAMRLHTEFWEKPCRTGVLPGFGPS